MKIAIAQINCTVGDLAGNAAKIADYAQRAKAQGADVLLIPELGLCGYPPEDLLLRDGFYQACDAALRDLAQQVQGITMVVGHPHKVGKSSYNAASVLRDGKEAEVPLEGIVPGDIVILAAGSLIPADLRVLSAKDFFVSQSALTGESLPVEKRSDLITRPDSPLAERQNMVYSSTLVSRGKGTGIVVATGMNTEIGRIAGIARHDRAAKRPQSIRCHHPGRDPTR